VGVTRRAYGVVSRGRRAYGTRVNRPDKGFEDIRKKLKLHINGTTQIFFLFLSDLKLVKRRNYELKLGLTRYMQ